MTCRHGGSLRLAVALWLAVASTPAAQACSNDKDALAELDAVRVEVTALFRETSDFEKHLDEALAARAEQSGWDAAATQAFKDRLLAHPEFQTMEKARDAATPGLIKAAARLLMAAAARDASRLCPALATIRTGNAQLRAVLDRQYAWLNRRIWDN